MRGTMQLAPASSLAPMSAVQLNRIVVFVFTFLGAVALRAQSGVPMLAQPLPSVALAPGGPASTIDARNYFAVPGVTGTQFARFQTVLGAFAVELRNDVAPRHVANFLSYARENLYSNSFIHRAASFENGPISIIQGGGYRLPGPSTIPKFAAVPLEYNLANARGTIAAARTNDPNSATSEWFINVRDNSAILGPNAQSPGYTVFGRVLGTGMTVVDALAATPVVTTFSAPFNELPLRNYTGGDPTEANLLVVPTIAEATLFPTGGGPSVIELAVENSAPNVVNAVLSGSTLTVAPLAPGTATITLRATDTNGNTAQGTFTASVASGAPVFTGQPRSQTVAAGTTVVFNAPATGAGSFRWEHNGSTVPSQATNTLVINNASAADAGTYQAFVTNANGDIASDIVTLTVNAVDPVNVGRLVNLSILTTAGTGAKVLTMGAFIGPGGSTGTLPLVIRAVGPTLAQPPFNVGGVLPDPVMNFYAAGNTTPLETNDNWGGSAALASAFRSVAAFDLPAASLDSAIVRTAPGVAAGGYTVQVTGKGNASGTVIAEMYDASGSERTATTPRLVNLSTLAQIDAGGDLAVGFVIGGVSARTVLVRGVGPSLGAFGIQGLMADPRLELFDNNTGARIASNDDWAGSLEIAAAATSVGAFPLASPTSKDAVLLITLPPGPYSARISGVGSTGGTAIVEVYEVQ